MWYFDSFIHFLRSFIHETWPDSEIERNLETVTQFQNLLDQKRVVESLFMALFQSWSSHFIEPLGTTNTTVAVILGCFKLTECYKSWPVQTNRKAFFKILLQSFSFNMLQGDFHLKTDHQLYKFASNLLQKVETTSKQEKKNGREGYVQFGIAKGSGCKVFKLSLRSFLNLSVSEACEKVSQSNSVHISAPQFPDFLIEQLNIRIIGLGWKDWKFTRKGGVSGKVAEVVEALKLHFHKCFQDPLLNNLPISPLSLETMEIPTMGINHATQQFLQLERETELKWDLLRGEFAEVERSDEGNSESVDPSFSTAEHVEFLSNAVSTQIGEPLDLADVLLEI